MINNAFHEHLKECQQCADHPFGLCPVGARLLTGGRVDATSHKESRDSDIKGLESGDVIGPFVFSHHLDGTLHFVQAVGLDRVQLHYCTVRCLLNFIPITKKVVKEPNQS